MILKANEPFSEEALRQAAARLRRQKLEQCTLFESPQPEPSEASEARILRTCDRYARCQRTKEYFRTFLAGLLALSLAGGAAAYGNPDLRERIGGWVREVTGKEMLFIHVGTEIPDDVLPHFSVDFIVPESYVLQLEIDDPGYRSYHYKGPNRSLFSVRVADYRYDFNYVIADEENLSIERGEINGNRYEFYPGREESPLGELIVWSDADQIIIIISSSLPTDEVIKTYQSMKINKLV